ncbi:hypothetical protein RCH09_000988 [Actimicrobium sp. GrIS 1.19]|uniref:C13 family peptidase n=1 Tax=Actimicrobium sp. GrIS 1.19 TaxID=3071708 RepID=UPI002E09E822|nr:hypothetical protein [Actimicrobium sp. GrIS 1.19]
MHPIILQVVLLGALLSALPDVRAQSAAQQALIERQVEVALYAQRPLLDKSLATIAPSDPNRIGMYFLGVAGDGTQEVFRREVEFVRNQFDRDFHTEGRSVVLINSRNTVQTTPMATGTSVRETLAAIAAKMDRDKDILFLFLTSHGSPDHVLSLAQLGMDLPPLSAGDLATLLKQQRIRWKVIVISACYAGGFVAPLKDDHTLIIAAARYDRSSFGCADDNDFTYFGRAFFKESVSASRSFDQAFQKASNLITRWEQSDRVRAGKQQVVLHSYPQISSPAPIAAYLEQWRQQLPVK